MELSEYCRALLEAKSNFGPLYGKGFFAVRLALAALGGGAIVYAHLDPSYGVTPQIAGILVLGYLAGSTLAQVRISKALKQRWPLQLQLLDWDKIEKLAKAPAPPA